MKENKFEKVLLERGIPFDHIKLRETIGEVKDLHKDYMKQMKGGKKCKRE